MAAGEDAEQLGEHLDFNQNPWVIDEDSTYNPNSEAGSAAGDVRVSLLDNPIDHGTDQAVIVQVEPDNEPPADAGVADDGTGNDNTEPFDAVPMDEKTDAPETKQDYERATDDRDMADEKYDLDDENPIGPVLFEILDVDSGIPNKVQSADGDTPQVNFDPKWRYNISMGDVVKRRVRVPNPKKSGEFIEEELFFPKQKSDLKVFCALKVKRVSDVSNVDETYNMRFHLYFNWLCPAHDYISYTKTKASQDNEAMMAWEPSWYPHIEIQNQVDGEIGWESYPEEGCFRIQTFKDFAKEKKEKVPEGQFDSSKARFIRAKLEVEGVFAEELELQSFPFDCQDLSCTIHERSSLVNCVFVPELRKPNFASIDPRYSVIDEWDLDTAIIEMGDAEGSRTGHAYSMIVIRLKMKRRFMVYIWSIVFLVACITFLALTSFALAEPDLGARLGLIITLILTAVAFSYVAFENLPNVPYLTLMDKYILSGYAFLVAVMIESAFLKQLGPNGDLIAFWVFFAIFWAEHVVFVIYSYILRQDELNKLTYSSDEIDDEVALQRPKIRFDYRHRKRAGREDRLLAFTGTIDLEGMSAKDKEKHTKYKEKLDKIGSTRHAAKGSNLPDEFQSVPSVTDGT